MSRTELPLSPAQIAQFHREGYTVAPSFFSSRELDALRAEVDRWQTEGAMRNVATEGDGETPSPGRHNLQLIPLDTRSDLYRAIPFHAKVLQAMKSLLGEPLGKILDQLFLKPAGSGVGTNWHTDNAYFHLADPLRGAAMWVALDDATIANGTLKVIPGRFYEKHEHSRDPDSDHHIRFYPDESEVVHCELQAGGVAFFCFGTPHATGSNTSGKPRTGVGIHFVNCDARPVSMRGENSRWRVVHLTGDRATGGAREYGVNVAGTWEREVDRVLSTR